ncbi:MAG: hypothetical protein HOY71_40325 [Nonomuraea sp.]|nr:hypothetical protein [Nonomuraea sp.]
MKDFPIGLFWPPPPYETTAERYQEIADAGINLVITGNYLGDRPILTRALECADAAGLDVIVAGEPRIDVLMRELAIGSVISAEDARALVRRVIDDYRGHPSFAGISLMDEPYEDRYANLAVGVEAVREAGCLPYVNLFPSHATGDYSAYVGGFVERVRPALLSFDRYPFLLDGEDDGYLDDLATIRRHAQAAGVPAWMYVQTCAYEGHRTPTAAEILWQVNSALAFGYTGVQYFTYWTPDPARGESFQPALITADGRRTERYDVVRRINTEWLGPVGAELARLTWVSAEVTDTAITGLFHDDAGAEYHFVCNALSLARGAGEGRLVRL